MRANYAISLAALAGLLLLFRPAEVAAGGKTKTPSATKILQESFNNLVKAKSYRARISVVGGVTQSKTHKVTARTVNDTYTGAVYGQVMEVSSPRSFRTPWQRGAIKKDGRWKNLVAARDGARMDRLFVWPQVVMQRALKYKSSATWIDRNKKKSSGKKSSKKKISKKSKSSKTGVAKGDDEDTVYFPGTIRVEAPTREALKHVVEVENSGCLSAG